MAARMVDVLSHGVQTARVTASCGGDSTDGSRPAAHARLTLLYGGLFLLSGAALMAIAYALFVANASHELRAPLTRLRAISEVALASPHASDTSLRAAHERVIASEESLEQLIDGLLTLTRGQAGLERREHVELATLTNQAIAAHQPRLTDRDLDLRTTLDPATTFGDPRLLERLISNLIDNAIRHNIPNGHLAITTGTRDKRPFLSITNTGPPRATTKPATDRHRPTQAPGGPGAAATDQTPR